MEKLQSLLSKAEIIKLRQDAVQTEMQFNIFRILRAGHEEVGLHSRFIHELLNPAGSHGMNEVFLNLFVEELRNEMPQLPRFSLDSLRVLREHANIDILIQDNRLAVVIENKIYAGDQYEQLQRYHEYVKRSHRQAHLFYLTLHGDKPAEHSAGDLPVTLISYKIHISRWITACIKEAASKPTLRETIIQYQTLVNQLTGNSMSEFEKQSVLALMAQGDNAEQAAIIVGNWNHVRWHTEWDFWTELAASVETKFNISEERFSEDAISKHINGGNNKDYYYGIEFSAGRLFGN